MDAQSIRTSANVPESSQGIDTAKKIKGRKRHIATDTLGLLLVLLVTAASVQDTAGGRDVADQLAARHPGVVKAWAQALPERSITMIHWTMIDNMSRRLTSESTQSWHDNPRRNGRTIRGLDQMPS